MSSISVKYKNQMGRPYAKTLGGCSKADLSHMDRPVWIENIPINRIYPI